jgi:hypothetical protein
LCKGVNTGVRSSSAVNAHSSAGDALKRAFDVILHRVAMRLALPAGEWRAVVRNDELESTRHSTHRRGIAGASPIRDALHAIEITLQDHLCSDLIDNTARLTGLLPCVS